MATILVVDDRPINRQLLMTLLGYGGHRLLEARDGAEALEVVRAERPNLVISDIVMPTMDGVEFVQRLRADPAIAQTRVIFYTATYRLREAQAMAQACGVSAVIPKPSEPEHIINTVNAALGLMVSPSASSPPPLSLPSQEALGESPSSISDKLSKQLVELQELDQKMTAAIERGLELVEERDFLFQLRDRLFQSQTNLVTLCLRLSALIELGLNAGSERDPRGLLELFCRAAQDIITAKYAAIGLLADDGQTLCHFITHGMDAETEARLDASLQPDRGVLGLLLEERRPRRIRDLDGDPQRVGLPASHPPIHSFLGVPILTPVQVYGWLYLADKLGAEEFSEVDEQVAVFLAMQIAVTYENARLYNELQTHAARLQLEVAERRRAEEELQQQLIRINLLNQIIRAIADRQDLKSISHVVLQQLEDQMPIDFGMVILYNSQANALMNFVQGPKSVTLAAELGIGEGTVLPVEDTSFHLCVRGEVVYVRDAIEEAARSLQKLAQRGIRSIVGVPLIIEGKVFGVLAAARREVEAFSDTEIEFLQRLSEHVALAAHQAQLYHDLQQAYDEIRTTQQAVLQQERLSALGTMASGIAHDFNNALSPIMGFSELLLNSPQLLGNTEKVMDCLKKINTSAEDAAAWSTACASSTVRVKVTKPYGLSISVQWLSKPYRSRSLSGRPRPRQGASTFKLKWTCKPCRLLPETKPNCARC